MRASLDRELQRLNRLVAVDVFHHCIIVGAVESAELCEPQDL